MEEKITQEKKQEYISIKDDFHKKRDEIDNEIKKYKLIIQNQNKEISKLEKDLENSKPVIDGCDKTMLCKPCDIYSMKHVGTQPGQGERIFHYECVICGYHDYFT